MEHEEETPIVVERIRFERAFGEALRAEIARRRPDLLLAGVA
jgi:hypothetical protein